MASEFHGVYRFDLRNGGRRLLTVDDGRIDIRESAEAAPCRIECDEGDFPRLVSGEENMMTAVLQGRVTIRGDLEMALRLHTALRSRKASPERAETPERSGKP